MNDAIGKEYIIEMKLHDKKYIYQPRSVCFTVCYFVVRFLHNDYTHIQVHTHTQRLHIAVPASTSKDKICDCPLSFNTHLVAPCFPHPHPSFMRCICMCECDSPFSLSHMDS